MTSFRIFWEELMFFRVFFGKSKCFLEYFWEAQIFLEKQMLFIMFCRMFSRKFGDDVMMFSGITKKFRNDVAIVLCVGWISG